MVLNRTVPLRVLPEGTKGNASSDGSGIAEGLRMIIRYYDVENVVDISTFPVFIPWAATSYWMVPGTFDPNDC